MVAATTQWVRRRRLLLQVHSDYTCHSHIDALIILLQSRWTDCTKHELVLSPDSGRQGMHAIAHCMSHGGS